MNCRSFLQNEILVLGQILETSIWQEKMLIAGLVGNAVPQTIDRVPLSFFALLSSSILRPSFSVFKIPVLAVFDRQVHH